MAEFSGFILTNKGRELLAKAVAGETLTFTKIGFGDGLFDGEKKEAEELTGLKNIFFINQIKKTAPGQVSLKTVITNRNIETGYHIREIGIYAVCEREEEVLYAYNTATEADYLPPFNGNNLIELEYQNYIVIDQAERVTAVIDPSATYLTKEEAEEVYVPQTQIAGEKKSGIVTMAKIRDEIGHLAHAQYEGVFGPDLKEIVNGRSYLYFDNNGDGWIYKAKRNNVNTAGFLVPSDENFINISNSFLSERINNIEYRISKYGQIANWSQNGLYNDPNYEIIKANSKNEFHVRVKEWGIYQFSAKAFVQMNANVRVSITIYNDGAIAGDTRNGIMTAGTEMLTLPVLANAVAAGKTIRFLTTGQTDIGSEWGYYITRLV